MRSIHHDRAPSLLNTTLYAEKCLENSDNIHFLTPIHQCYNGYEISHDVFTKHDIYDVLVTIPKNTDIDEGSYDGGMAKIEDIHVVGVQRTFYKSKDASCSGGKTDSFDNIPLGICVGPFGPPYPWGRLEIVENSSR